MDTNESEKHEAHAAGESDLDKDLKEASLEHLRDEEALSVTELINSLPSGRGSKSSAEVDEYLHGERNSWDH